MLLTYHLFGSKSWAKSRFRPHFFFGCWYLIIWLFLIFTFLLKCHFLDWLRSGDLWSLLTDDGTLFDKLAFLDTMKSVQKVYFLELLLRSLSTRLKVNVCMSYFFNTCILDQFLFIFASLDTPKLFILLCRSSLSVILNLSGYNIYQPTITNNAHMNCIIYLHIDANSVVF